MRQPRTLPGEGHAAYSEFAAYPLYLHLTESVDKLVKKEDLTGARVAISPMLV